MFKNLLDEFDWKKVSELTGSSIPVLRHNVEKDLAEVYRQSLENRSGHIITTPYDPNSSVGPMHIEVAGRVVIGLKKIAMTVKLVAVKSYQTVDLE
jgi:hypothetical protein